MSAARQRLRRRHTRTGAALLGVVVLCAGLANVAPGSAGAGVPVASAPIASRPVAPDGPTPAAAGQPNVAFTDDTDHLVTLPARESNPHDTGFNDGDVHEGEASDSLGTQAFVSTEDNPNGEVYISFADETGAGLTPISITCDNFTKTHPVVSPDGQEIAYATNASGRFQIEIATVPEIGIDGVQPAVANCTGISYQTLPGQSGDNLWPTWVDDNTLIYSSTRDNALGDLYEQALGTGTTATRLTDGVQSNGDLVGNTQPAYDASHGAVYLTTTQFRSDGSIGYFPLNTTPLPTTPINAWLNTTPPPQSSEVDPGWFCVPSGTSEQCLHGVAYTSTDNDPYGGVYFTEFEASVDSINPSSIRTVADTPGVSESHPALMNTGSTPQSEGIIFTQRSIGAQISSVAADGTGRGALIPTAGRDQFDTSKPAYSPDGTRIAYSRSLVSSSDVEDGSIPTRQIFITNADGSGTPTPIGPFEDGTTSSGQFDIDTAPAWSPDGTKLAFSRTIAQFSSDESAHAISQEIWVVNVADPNNAAPLAVPGQGNFFDSAPSWSPDGRHIVISRVPDSTDLSLDMSSFPDPVRPGQTVTVRGFIANDAPGTANGLVLTFDFPDGLTPTTLPSGCAFGTSGQQVVCTQATLAAGDFADFDVQAIGSLPPGLGSVQYAVRGEVTSTTPETDDRDNIDTAIVTVADSSDLSVAIDMQSESGSGTLADNTVTAHNFGPDTALNVVVTTTFSDTPAAYGTLSPGCSASGATVICTLSSLAPGASQTFGIQASWTTNCHGNGETVTGTSTIRSDSTDSDTSDNTRSDSIFIDPGVCLAAQPAPRPDRASRAHRSVQPSVAATQAIAITNHEGVRGLTLDTPPGPPELWVVSATDGTGAVLPPPTPCGADCAIGGIEPAWSPDGLHIAYESGGQIDVATLSDTTGATTTSITPLTGYATYAADTGGKPTLAYPRLATAHDPTWWPDGSKLVFTGQPAGQPDNVGIYLINADGSGLQTITQEPGPESEPSVQAFADLAVAVNPPTQTIFTAQTANIDATVTNHGPGRAASPTLTFTLPSGLTLDAASPNCTQPPVIPPTTITCTFTTLASGDSATATISVESDTGGTYTVPAAVSSTTPDGNTGNNTASAVVVVRSRADISTAITGYSDSGRTNATHEFKTGDPMFFRASITNSGAGAAMTNTFRITIPAGVHDPTALDPSCTFTPTGPPGSDSGGVIACTVPSPLAPGSSASFNFDDSSSVSGGYTFAADGTTSTPETDTTNNHSEWDVRVLNHAGITLTMVATSPIALGDSSDLTATVSNAGPDSAFGVTLTITIPTGMDPPTTVPTGCTIATTTMTCLLGDIAIGDFVTVTFTSQSTALGSHEFDGTATTDNDVPSSSSDKATVVVIPRKADLSVTITLSQTTAQPGDSLTATIKVHNAGPQEAVNTKLTTTFDSRLDATALPSCAAGGTCSLGTLNPGDDATFIVNLHPQESGTPPNNYTASMSAQVTSDTLDPNTANNKATATLPVIQQLTDVAVAVTVAPVAYVGGTTSAKITVVNHGPAAASDVRLNVTMPVQLAATATPACVTGTSVCNLGTFASGAHRTFTISLVPHRLHKPRSYAVTIAVKVATSSIESTLANNQDSAKLPVKQPRLQLLPPIGPPGFVTLAFGENLPPGAIVTLRWREGITTFDGPYRVAADGTVEAPMLIVRRDELGPRQALLRGRPGRFEAVLANMLVVPNTEQPPRFLGRG